LLRVRMDMRRLLDSLLEYDIVSDWFSRASMCDSMVYTMSGRYTRESLQLVTTIHSS
jgi:hypothetical protein